MSEGFNPADQVPAADRVLTADRDLTARRVLVVSGGHSVDYPAFWAMFAALAAEHGWLCAYAVQPAAQQWLTPDAAGSWDVIVLHDIVGLHLRRGEPPVALPPTADTVAALIALLDAGQPLVVTHHSLASWPTWDGWAAAIGGRFNYAPGRLRGVDWPSSGTYIDTYTAQVVAPTHPVCDGVGDFELTDELYCCPIFDEEVIPLVRSGADFSGARFIRTYEHVVVGAEQAPDCLDHPPASNLIAWAKVAGRSPLVYIQPGDTASTFGNAPYRRLMANAINWVASTAARSWAAANPTSIDVNS